MSRHRDSPTAGSEASQDVSRIPHIIDQYSGLLDDLTAGQLNGLIAKLSNGYYDGWRPTRAQLARYLHREFGIPLHVTTPHDGFPRLLRPDS